MNVSSLEQVRARIAQLILGEPDNQQICIGNIQLRPHQRSAVLRIRQSLREFGGAVLCDPVGTGKTFTALAVPPVNARLIVVAPAVLGDMWSRALAMAGRSAEFISFESLSRGSLPEVTCDFVIVDEAHHARNPKTVRYGLLARLVSCSDAIFLTATPIHNRRADLVALTSLFLGERAAALSPGEITRCVIRREAPISGMPAADAITWMRLREDHRIPTLLLSLPQPLPPRDSGDGGVLITRSLIRQWASSDAALMGGLKRRIVRAESLIAALSDNTWPTKQELLSWIAGDDSVQLGLPGILAGEVSDTNELIAVVRSHCEGLKRVIEVLSESSADIQRASLIRRIRRIHNDRSIVAFSEYADTINGLLRELAKDGGVCALTASGARVAGGTLSRAEAIGQFAPIANGLTRPPTSNAITLLLTTDLLSEGVNLQDAGVVIHLDLPWTPARMEQRLGRVARVGSRHERVPSYAFRPPLSGETVVRMERILGEKLAAAGSIVPAPFFLPCIYAERDAPTVLQRSEAIRSLLLDWDDVVNESGSSSPVIAGVLSTKQGFIAVAEIGDAIRVFASAGGLVTESAETILDVLEHCRGTPAELDSRYIQSYLRTAVSWIEADLALPSSHTRRHATTSIRTVVTKRIHRLLRAARPHERARIAMKVEKVFASIAGHLGVYHERRILEMCEQVLDVEALSDQIIELTARKKQSVRQSPKILAMIVLVRK
jgi:hypothetical protein